MIVVEALIVPGASWVSAIKASEAKKASLNVPLACFVMMWKIRSSTPEVTVETLSVVPGTIFASCTDHSRLKASARMCPPARTARLCHTIKTTVKPPLTSESLNLRRILRGIGLARQTAARMIKPISIRQNRNRRRRKMVRVFGLILARVPALILDEEDSPLSKTGLAGPADVEMLLMMGEKAG